MMQTRLWPRLVIPKPFDERLFVEVPYAVAKAAVQSGVGDAGMLDGYRTSLEKRNVRRMEVFK